MPAIVLAALMPALAADPQEQEPTYKSRTISEWLQGSNPRHPDAWALNVQTMDAIRHIGTNAIPIALRWISYDQPEPPYPEATRPLEVHVSNAETCFYLLGAQAQTAIPELTRLALTSTSEARVQSCTRALVYMRGAPGLQAALLSIITNSQAKGRSYVIQKLRLLREDALPLVPTLLSLLQANQDGVASVAASSLGQIGLSPSKVVPALTEALQSTNRYTRAGAAYGLGEFRKEARTAVPQLTHALTDPQWVVRREATNALLKVAPELLTNTPPR